MQNIWEVGLIPLKKIDEVPMTIPTMITKTTDLKEICDKFSHNEFVTMDTEFIREKTYYPVLCLIQIASPEEAYCIDPLSEELDMTPLFDLLQNDKVLKVFHAARQDVEIFVHLTGKVPTPLFDTQIGAMVCGFNESVSYQQLVQELTGVSLDKSMRYTDWSKRPLSDKQIQYALCDVTHLVHVFEKLRDQLKKSGRMTWLAEEMEILNDVATYEVDDETIWQKLKNPLTKPQALHVFAKVSAWRERMAKLKNRPRRHILKDEALLELAAAHPTTLSELETLRGMPGGLAKSNYGAELVEIIAQAMNDKPSVYVPSTKRPPLANGQKNLAELLRFLLSVVADELGVASKVIASSDDIADFVVGKKESKILTGWRMDVFGKKAIALKEGKIFFSFDPKKKHVVVIEK